MRKLLFPLFSVITIFLFTGCYDTIQEITLKEDGSGTISNTNDLSALIAVVKQMGGAEEMEKAGDQKIDSSFSLADKIGEMPGLTSEEKEMAARGTLHITMDLKGDKFLTQILFPLANPSEVPFYNQLSTKILAGTLKDQMAEGMPGAGGGEMPDPTTMDDYFTLSFFNGVLEKKINKEKYANVESDEYLKGLKQTADMGMDMNATYIINLPKPATKVEGTGAKLSEDKMKVTVTASLSDFFENPSLLEYRIEY